MGETIREKADRLSREPHIRPFIMDETMEDAHHSIITPERRFGGAYTGEEWVTIYGALSTYLTILAQQPEKDLETIARVTRLMIAVKPQAVEASQEISSRNTAS